MRKQFTHFVAVMLLFVIAESARSQNKQLNSMRPEITKVSLPEALSRQIARDDNAKVKSCQLCGGGGDDDAKWLVENVTTLSVDLSGDGKPEWIVGYCGNHACSGWIYRRVGERYEMILRVEYRRTRSLEYIQQRLSRLERRLRNIWRNI